MDVGTFLYDYGVFVWYPSQGGSMGGIVETNEKANGFIPFYKFEI